MKESPTFAPVPPKAFAVASRVSWFDNGGKLVLGSTPRPKASFRRAALLPVTEAMMLSLWGSVAFMAALALPKIWPHATRRVVHGLERGSDEILGRLQGL